MFAAVAGLGAFVWWERRATHPMLDLSLFKNPLFTVSSIALLIAFFALMGAFYLLAQVFQLVLGYGALESSLLTLPVMLPMLALSPLAAKVWARLGARVTIGGGLLIIAAGFLLSSTWTAGSGYWAVLLPLLAVVVGLVAIMTPATNLILSAVPRNRSGMGSAMNDTVRELGGALGVAVLGALIGAGYGRGISGATAGLSADLAEQAEGSLAAAIGSVAPAVAAESGGAASQAFARAATDAWMSGLTSAMLVAAACAGVAALWTFVAMPHKRREARWADLATSPAAASALAGPARRRGPPATWRRGSPARHSGWSCGELTRGWGRQRGHARIGPG